MDKTKNMEKNLELAAKLRASKPQVDERVNAASIKNLAAAGLVAIFYVVARIVYKGFHGEAAVPEIVLMFMMLAAMWLVNIHNNVHVLPTFFTKTLDPSPSARLKRIVMYAAESLFLAVMFGLVNYFGNITGSRTITEHISDLALTFAVCMIAETLLNENRVRKYNKYIAELDAQENDLS